MLTIESFMDKVSPEPTSGCWLWLGALSAAGYGVTGNKGYAHRYAYEQLIGKIPDGLCIDHLCRVRCCVNPAHMEPVTRGENVRRGLTGSLSKARGAAVTHCRHGHELSGYNAVVRVNKKGYTCRGCRTCGVLRVKEKRRLTRVSRQQTLA